MDKDDIQFERDKLAYQQNADSFRHMNTQMWQVPIIAMTLTGGLWFGVFSSSINDYIAGGLLVFAGICDLLFIFILRRVRYIMKLIIEKLKDFNPDYAINPLNSNKTKWPFYKENLVINAFTSMLILAALFSFLTATYKFLPWLCK